MEPKRLREISLQSVYHSKSNSLIEDFYIPALSVAIQYDRAVGFFSSAMLAYAARGLLGLVRNNGRMRLIIGSTLSDEEYAALKDGVSRQQKLAEAERRLAEILEKANDRETKFHLDLLCFLVASERLKIRVAFTQKGMFHDKTGIIRDAAGDKLVFQGSANETVAALLPDFNYESISVFPSWRGDVFIDYGQPFEEEFERIWSGDVNGVVTVDVLSSTYDLMKKYAPTTPPTRDEYEQTLPGLENRSRGNPHHPVTYGGMPYALKLHQIIALKKWKAAGYRGIFNMATGAGKTVTALHAATDICCNSSNSLVVLIIVPYQNLGDQWCEVAEEYGFAPLQAYRSINQWRSQLITIASSLLLPGNKSHYCIVSVKNTFCSPEFQKTFGKIPNDRIVLIADECHHYATTSYSRAIPAAGHAIGLSATPWRPGDIESQQSLENSFGRQCFQYTIDEAMHDDVLCKYEYHPTTIHLTDEEYEQYSELSREISKLYSMKENGAKVDDIALNIKLMARSRILGSADEKFSSLAAQLAKRPKGKKVLFYCGDGSTEDAGTLDSMRDIERVGEVLHRFGWRSSRFTAEESRTERQRILTNFSDEFIDAMVSIRVLDEGIDIPSCSEAYLLASSRNERQYVQRRGRILRKSKDKTLASIHDFICLPPAGSRDAIGVALVAAELHRFREFSRLAENRLELDALDMSLSTPFGIGNTPTLEPEDAD